MNGLPYDFTDKEVSPWGDLRLIEEAYRRCRLKRYLEEQCPGLPSPESNRRHRSVDLAEGFMVSTILGATRLAHSGTLRHDEVIQRIFKFLMHELGLIFFKFILYVESDLQFK